MRAHRIVSIAIVAAAVLVGPVSTARAHWLSGLGEIAATAGKAGKLAGEAAELSAGLAAGAKVIAKLPAELRAGAIAAEALPDGAWRLHSAAGETITATSADGVKAALAGLKSGLPDSGTAGLTFYVGEDSAFQNPVSLASLPADAKLQLAIEDASYPLLRQGDGVAAQLYAELNGGVILRLADRKLFDEAIWQLRRPLGKAGIRVLHLDTGGPKILPGVGRRSADGLPLAESIDPDALAVALGSIRGQTIIVSGRMDAKMLAFAGKSGPPGTIALDELLRAAEAQDVNLLLLDTGAAKQPGGTTWLWQERGIAGLDSAMAKASLGDFITVLARGQGRLAIAADWGEGGHFRLTVTPPAADAPAASGEVASAGISGSIGDFAAVLSEKLAGHVAPQATTISLNNEYAYGSRCGFT